MFTSSSSVSGLQLHLESATAKSLNANFTQGWNSQTPPSPDPSRQRQQSSSDSAVTWNAVSEASFGTSGSQLSAHSQEFKPSGQWKQSVAPTSQQSTFITLTEPINYRHLLEKPVNCDWSYIVQKIVSNNDQQASIFLQQKLKIGTQEQRYSIIESIVEQAYPLMINRFGNFLVQRCFEHGTPDQVHGIANAIRGNVLSLSMDAFGCHVVQKALDCVAEDIKAEMVMELLRRVAETVVHRYACHVWQKLFELRWEGTPPAIMHYVNQELTGLWTQVALGETGSLVVQNIFENCIESEKRPCIEEVLANLDVIARGQWGNWVIQHIIEYGAQEDQKRALDEIIQNAVQYSMDQCASKVIEKMLKFGGPEIIDRYLARICDGRADRPRIPLIDIASDAHGNYLIQYILNNASKQHRDLVAAQIKRHMVSLRGSKWGSKCAWLVERYRNQTSGNTMINAGLSSTTGRDLSSHTHAGHGPMTKGGGARSESSGRSDTSGTNTGPSNNSHHYNQTNGYHHKERRGGQYHNMA
ncbi:armadillo-type protein [Lipomyces oligophaga]|uniref:armadillo-type protein n=1 Tax=Lipomyces oligophaga TaxID=45792 RepID=UPI0034CDAB8D